MVDITRKRIIEFQKKIFTWWDKNRRDLPWRHTHDPYKILVSEVMLQQTQVSRVLPKYREFLLQFPTILALSSSPLSNVLLAWKGMGYNRRAKYLRQSAQVIVGKYHGVFPSDEVDLLSLPGIGVYTARAIQVFAWERDVAMVDTNIRQIIVHYFFSGVLQTPRIIQDVADQIIPVGRSWEWHQALMDHGSIAMPRAKNFSARATIPFKDSPRFIRGKIIDMLRDKSYEENILSNELIELYDKPKLFVARQLDALVSEKLIERVKSGSVRLMES